MIDVLISPPQKRTIHRKNESGKSEGDRPITSLLKTISWRIVGTIDTITISYIITGEIRSALSIGSIEVVSKMILYYFHERLWSKRGKLSKTRVKMVDHNELIKDIGTN